MDSTSKVNPDPELLLEEKEKEVSSEQSIFGDDGLHSGHFADIFC